MSKSFNEVVKARRSIYGISKEKVASDEAILKLVRHAVKYAPSSFNSQSARVVILLGKEHDKLWAFTKEILQKVVPAESFAVTEEKLNAFGKGYGTILYFEDQSTVQGLQERFALYKDNFPKWSLESSGMLQYIIWSALEAEGFGASLQHYDPLIDEQVKAVWKIPDSWKLLGEMPFGKPVAEAVPKTFLPLDERIKVFK
jgi:predicted oxidoreductase (fatty acid repression mutant protein)